MEDKQGQPSIMFRGSAVVMADTGVGMLDLLERYWTDKMPAKVVVDETVWHALEATFPLATNKHERDK